jgi:protein-S-isoprenylcysteine O-methyltransferase Ste14
MPDGKISLAKKLFGVGPLGALLSGLILAACVWAERAGVHAPLTGQVTAVKIAAVFLIGAGAGLHFWTIFALRKWWIKGALCVAGPFRWFRHPMYAAWLTFIIPGVALYLNSWICVGGALLIHALWHGLVISEERMLLAIFGDEYRRYAASTGRFVPRLWRMAVGQNG